MRIAFIDHKLNLRTGGGGNINLHHELVALTEAGHEVTVITLAPSRNAYPPDLPYTVIEHRLGERYAGLRHGFALVAYLKRHEHDFDIYQLESPGLIQIGGLYRRLGGKVPVVAKLTLYTYFCTNVARMDSKCFRHCSLVNRIQHGPESPSRKLLKAPVRAVQYYCGRLVVNEVDRFIALTEPVAEIHSWYGIDPAKLVVIPPLMEWDALGSQVNTNGRSARAADAAYSILYVGRLVHEKGVDILLRAIADIPFPVQVEILGEGATRGDLEHLTDELGLGSTVRFRGWVSQDEMSAYYHAADVFVHPGRWPEPAGRTVMDALCYGTPVVTSNIGGPPWLAGEAALTFTPEDPTDLREKLVKLHDQPDLARNMAVAARQRAQRFDRRPVLAQLLALYEGLVPVTP